MRYFERRLPKTLKEVNSIFFFAPSHFVWARSGKTKETWNQLPVSLHIAKHVKKNSLFSDLGNFDDLILDDLSGF